MGNARVFCIYLGSCQCYGTKGSCIASFNISDPNCLGGRSGLGGSFGEAVGGLGFLGFPHIDVRKYISRGGVLRSISLKKLRADAHNFGVAEVACVK